MVVCFLAHSNLSLARLAGMVMEDTDAVTVMVVVVADQGTKE